MIQIIDACKDCKFVGAKRCATCARKYVDRYEKKPVILRDGKPVVIKYHDDRTIVHHGGCAVIEGRSALGGSGSCANTTSEHLLGGSGGGSERNGGGC